MSFSERQAKLSLRVYPNAIRNEVIGFADGILRVKISAPPVKGKANRELLAFLSQLLGISPGAVIITKGYTSRNKIVAVDGLSQEELLKRLLRS